MIQVFLPSQLDTYTGGEREQRFDHAAIGTNSAEKSATPVTLLAVIKALDQRFPGLAFRIVDEQGNIRRHIAMFVGEDMVRSVDVVLGENARVQIVGALSGG